MGQKTRKAREREPMELRMDQIIAYQFDSRTDKSPPTLGLTGRSVAPVNSCFPSCPSSSVQKETRQSDKASDENIAMACSSFLR